MRRQSKSQITGREGERWFESMLPPEWSIQRPIDDFGIDGIVAVGSKTHLTPYEFGIQVKSSGSIKKYGDHVISPRIDREVLIYLLSKFFPTLIVVYDSKRKEGYCDWAHNLVTMNELRSERRGYYLKLPRVRTINAEFWVQIASEVREFHQEFVSAFQNSRQIIPLAHSLSSGLATLCSSRLLNSLKDDDRIPFAIAHAWTHILVVRELNNFLSCIDPSTTAAKRLNAFKDVYARKCRTIFHDFDQYCDATEMFWVAVKVPPESEPTTSELIAMLADCVCGLLSTSTETKQMQSRHSVMDTK